MKKILKLDYFSYHVYFQIHNFSGYKTYFGAFTSLVGFLSLFYIFIEQLTTLLNRENFTYSSLSLDQRFNQNYNISLQSVPIFIRFSFFDYSNKVIPDNKIKNISDYVLFQNLALINLDKKFPLEKCNDSSVNYTDIDKDYRQTSYCIGNVSQSSVIYSSIIIGSKSFIFSGELLSPNVSYAIARIYVKKKHNAFVPMDNGKLSVKQHIEFLRIQTLFVNRNTSKVPSILKTYMSDSLSIEYQSIKSYFSDNILFERKNLFENYKFRALNSNNFNFTQMSIQLDLDPLLQLENLRYDTLFDVISRVGGVFKFFSFLRIVFQYFYKRFHNQDMFNDFSNDILTDESDNFLEPRLNNSVSSNNSDSLLQNNREESFYKDDSNDSPINSVIMDNRNLLNDINHSKKVNLKDVKVNEEIRTNDNDSKNNALENKDGVSGRSSITIIKDSKQKMSYVSCIYHLCLCGCKKNRQSYEYRMRLFKIFLTEVKSLLSLKLFLKVMESQKRKLISSY